MQVGIDSFAAAHDDARLITSCQAHASYRNNRYTRCTSTSQTMKAIVSYDQHIKNYDYGLTYQELSMTIYEILWQNWNVVRNYILNKSLSLYLR
jgi:hypothetical protein